MSRHAPFERRLLLALVLFSLVPSLLLVGVGTYLLSETIALQTSPSAWRSVAGSGRELLDLTDRSGDPALQSAAGRHREELSASLLQSGRWEYLNQRALRAIPIASLVLIAMLIWMAVRAARGIAREMARPIRELVGWSALIAGGKPLPAAPTVPAAEHDEFGTLRDAFRQMEAELAASREKALEAERMRTWVTVARSVAHELKNSLTPLRLGVAALERRTSADRDALESIEVISLEAARLEELARAFSQLGRLPEGVASEIDLREQLDYLLRTHLPPSVTYRLRAPVDLPTVLGHHDALSRAFANLLLNAVDAMGDAGGSVLVEMRSVLDGVEVRIQDSGPGIDPAHSRQIWEPDFTTKSRGTGLGLALVRQTIVAHGGSISARNRPGGAEFRVFLPRGGGETAGRVVGESVHGATPLCPAAAGAG
jgi:nitrogen fixation/metabolism regulation signal transduction histidine kinase